MNKKLIYSLIEQFSGSNLVDEESTEVFLAFFNDLDIDTRKKLGLLINIVNTASTIRYFKGFSGLKEQQREKILNFFARSPISKLQGGITGLRSICLVAFYSCEKNRQLINLKN